jgi:cysteine desulfurase
MMPYLGEEFGNPSSGHGWGRRARAAIEAARAEVAGLLGCAPDEVIFTSGGTEANNLAIRGTAMARPRGRHLVTSLVEHPATAVPCRDLERQGWRVSWAGVDETGRVRAGAALAALDDDCALVTILHANNETGTLQPIAEVARGARARGALVHSDAAQSAGKIPVDVEALGVDLLSVAGHKLYAPKGVGALYVRRGTPLSPVILGAGQERGIRPGTESVASIVGLGASCEIARRTLEGEMRRVRALRDRLWALLSTRVPGLALNGHPTERLPNTLNVRFPGVLGSAVLAAAPEVAASVGSACHEGAEEPSSVLLAMGLPAKAALGAVRLSLGRRTTEEEVARAAEALARAWASIQ